MKNRVVIAILAAIFAACGIIIILSTVEGDVSTVNPVGFVFFGIGLVLMMIAGASAASNRNKK